MSSIETGQMSAVETGQMSAAETRQMSAVETGQLSPVARTDIRLVSTYNVDVSEISIVPISQCSCLRNLNCGNVTVSKSQIGGLALTRRKWPEIGPEWSPGPENRPPGMPQPFSCLWDRSCDPKPPKYSLNS